MVDVIDVPIYMRTVAFLVEITKDELMRFYYDNVTKITDEEYKMLVDDFDSNKIAGTTYTMDSGLYLVFLRQGNSDMFVPHEIFHVCNRILCEAGVNHDAYAEPWAYLIGWMTNEYYRKYWAWVDSTKEKK